MQISEDMFRFLVLSFFCFDGIVFFSSSFAQDASSESDLFFPQLELTTIRVEMSQSSLDSLLDGETNDIVNHSYHASIHYESSGINSTLNNIGVRLRGNTSLNSPKKSFKLDFNAFIPDQKLFGLEKLNLNANQNDPSIFRASLSWHIIREMEIPGSRTAHAKLFINDEYMGVYVVTEHLDEQFINQNYEKKYGNLYKCLWPAPLHYLGDDPDLYKYEANGRRSYDLKTNKLADDYSDLSEFISVLNNSSNENFVCEIERVFNVVDYLKIIAFDVLIGNWDGYVGNKNNYYLYHNPLTGLFDYIPYDLDNTWGITWGNYNWENENPYNWASSMSFGNEFRPLYERILSVQEYRDLFTHYLIEIIHNWFNEQFVLDYISPRQPLLYQSIVQDVFYPLSYGFNQDDFQNSLTDAWGGHVRFGFIDWVNARLEYINYQLEDEMSVLVPHQIFDNAPVLDTLKISAKVYAYDQENIEVSALVDTEFGLETMSMFDNGLHSDGEENDGVWGLEIPVLSDWTSVDYSVEVSTDELTKIAPCTPVNAVVGVKPGDLVINELMSLNSLTVSDEFMEFDDWCELYNTASNPIDINGFYLTDNISRPEKYALPFFVADEGEHMLYWLDNDPEQGSNHAPFRLSSEGEELALFQKQQNLWYLRDYISFGSADEDVSFGRIEDGAFDWHWFQTPTPNSTNNFVDIKELTNNYLKVWPNPTDIGIIKFNALRSGTIQDLLGAKVFDFLETDFVDIGVVPSGVYFLKTTQGEMIQIIRY